MSRLSPASDSPASSPWLSNRLKLALGIAVLEAILVAVEKDFTRWTLIIISAPIILFYILAGRTLQSETGRQVAWVAAAAQAFAVVFTVIALVIGAFVLIVAGIFAVIALILIFGERDRPKQQT